MQLFIMLCLKQGHEFFYCIHLFDEVSIRCSIWTWDVRVIFSERRLIYFISSYWCACANNYKKSFILRALAVKDVRINDSLQSFNVWSLSNISLLTIPPNPPCSNHFTCLVIYDISYIRLPFALPMGKHSSKH